MRYFLTLSVLLLFASSSFAQVVEDTTDSFSEKRRISTKIEYLEFKKTGENDILRACSDVVWVDETWAIRFVFVSETWVFLDEEKMYFVVDGKRFKRRIVYIDQHKKDGVLYDVIGTLFKKDDAFYRALKNATDIKIEIGEYVISANNIVDQEIDSILTQIEKEQ